MANSTGQTPQVVKQMQNVGAVAAGSDASTPAFRAPFAGTVSGVTYASASAITGANTNTRTLTLKNRGTDGLGTTAVAALALASGVNTVAFDEKTITLSGVEGALTVAEGDILSWESIHAASGLADPGGLAIVEFTRS